MRVLWEMRNAILPHFRIRTVKAATAALLAASVLAFPARSQTAAASNENLKIEKGNVYEMLPDLSWKAVGPATLGNAIKALQDIFPTITIASDPRLASLPVADLLVRSSDPAANLEALSVACGYKFSVQRPTPNLANPNANSDLFELAPTSSFLREHGDEGSRDLQVFSIAGYLRQLADEQGKKNDSNVQAQLDAVDRLQDIIRDTVSAMDDKMKPPQVKFYAQAKLLVVIGSPEALDIAGKVVAALPGQQGVWMPLTYGSLHNQGESLYRSMGNSTWNGNYSILNTPAPGYSQSSSFPPDTSARARAGAGIGGADGGGAGTSSALPAAPVQGRPDAQPMAPTPKR